MSALIQGITREIIIKNGLAKHVKTWHFGRRNVKGSRHKLVRI